MIVEYRGQRSRPFNLYRSRLVSVVWRTPSPSDYGGKADSPRICAVGGWFT